MTTLDFDLQGSPITLIGHPFAPIGRGEDVRCAYRALKRAGAQDVRLLSLYAEHQPDGNALGEFGASMTGRAGGLNVFFINGDEIQATLEVIGGAPGGAYNVIYPAWELPVFPRVWLDQLTAFDAVWTPSRFIQTGMQALTTRPVVHQPLACEVRLDSFLNRRHFGIPEAAYTFLFFFDLRSYAARKNPWAVVEAFEKARAARPWANTCLVLKIHGSERAPEAAQQLRTLVQDKKLPVIFIDRTMSDNETKNLVRCADCFVSLHRSEGFGRGMAEAMYLGKPVIATRYSGNTDFMNEGNSLLVDYDLVSVKDGEYPHGAGQVWAQADVHQAASHMLTLIDSPGFGRRIGREASRQVRSGLGYLPTGIRYLEALASR